MFDSTREPAGGRAVVMGASLAGLLAARVLSERYGEVVLVERDLLPEGAQARKGTPQAVHPHGLLARGLEVLEELFPGFTAAMVARGAVAGDMQAGAAFYANRQRFAAARAGRPALGASRLAIEAEVRQRVRARAGVRFIEGADALPPRLEGGRVVAARFALRGEGASDPVAQELAASLVVDCTGRGSRAPQWLRDWGYEPPPEEQVDIDICYTSAYFRRTGPVGDGAGMDLVAEFGAVSNAQPYPGVVIAQEPSADGTARWVVGVGGFCGDHAAATLAALRERAAAIGSPQLARITHEGELMGDVIRYRMPHSQRRRYERLKRFPQGLLAMGDAITSFNPIYGQGMTVAACEALVLREALAASADPAGLAGRFFRGAGRVVDVPWTLAVGGDLSMDQVPGPRPLPVRIVNAYIGRLHRVAPHDAVVSTAFQKVVHMLSAPTTLFAPHIVWRVLRGPRPQRAGAAAAATATAPASGTSF